MTTCYAAMWYEGRPVVAEGPGCLLHGALHRPTRGYRPISVLDRPSPGYGPWLTQDGQLIETNFQDSLEAIPTDVAVLDCETGYAELWSTVERMLELARERRPDVRFGVYVGPSARQMNADAKILLEPDDPAMVQALTQADFVAQSIYAFVTDEPTRIDDNTWDWQRLGFFRHRLGHDLRRWMIRGLPVMPVSCPTYHTREGEAGLIEGNQPVSLRVMREMIAFAERFPEAIFWGGYRFGPVPPGEARSLAWRQCGEPWQYLAAELVSGAEAARQQGM